MEIYPNNLRTGAPITVRCDAMRSDPKEVKVVPVAVRGAKEFFVPLVPGEQSKLSGQFILLLPGQYRLQFGKETREIYVNEQVNLSFQKEFGIFSIAVLIIVGGMVLWLKQTKKTGG